MSEDTRPWETFAIQRGHDVLAELLPVIGQTGYIAGSFAAWAMSWELEPWLPGDIDIFATSGKAARRIANRVYTRCNGVTMTENDTCFTIARTIDRLNVQVVKPNPVWKTWPDDIMNDFDMNVCRAVVESSGFCLADYEAGGRVGRILRIANPLRTLKRVYKYQARGVVFDDWELIKLFSAWEHWPEPRRTALCDDALAERTAKQMALEYRDNDAPYAYYDDDDWFEGE